MGARRRDERPPGAPGPGVRRPCCGHARAGRREDLTSAPAGGATTSGLDNLYRDDIFSRYMESEQTPTAYVILGMLKIGRRTGYDIKQMVDFSTRFFWATSYGQIYPELKTLEENGLIE